MKRLLEYELADGGGLLIDFDADQSAKYEVKLHPEEAETGDGVIITLNRRGCVALARLFAQLAERGGHAHLGYTEDEPQDPGLRIVVEERVGSPDAGSQDAG